VKGKHSLNSFYPVYPVYPVYPRLRRASPVKSAFIFFAAKTLTFKNSLYRPV